MTLSELCIRRPVMTTLITASIIVFGAFAYRLLPVAALPKVDFPTIQVVAQLPGASAETMAASVAAPIERQLSTIAGISSMTSSAAPTTPRDDIPTAVAKPNSNVPIGPLPGPKQNAPLQATAAMERAADYRNVVVAWRNGMPVKLQEIARVIDSVENNQIASWFNG